MLKPIERPYYLNQLIKRRDNGRIKVITGLRRCGKSYLLFHLFKDYLIQEGVDKEHIIEMNLEDIANLEYRNPLKLDAWIKEKIQDKEKKYYVFIDEIQLSYEIKNPHYENSAYRVSFVDVLNGLRLMDNVDVYVTGSNSRSLSKDIHTQFRGRNDQIQVYPFSFEEYMRATSTSFDQAWKEYSVYGGMPEVLMEESHEDKAQYLSDLIGKIYIKDIVERYNIHKDESILRILLEVLASNVGSLINTSKLANILKSEKKISITAHTLDTYLGYFEDAFLISSSKQYDVKGNRYFISPNKYYFVDLGLRNCCLNFRQSDEGHGMENILYIDLKRRGYSVDIGRVLWNTKDKQGKSVRIPLEVDFVLNRGNEKVYIQSTVSITDPKVKEREIRSLKRINDSFKKIVIVKDDVIPLQDEFGIHYVGIQRFLFDASYLDASIIDSYQDLLVMNKIQMVFEDWDTTKFVFRKCKQYVSYLAKDKAIEGMKHIIRANSMTKLDEKCIDRMIKMIGETRV